MRAVADGRVAQMEVLLDMTANKKAEAVSFYTQSLLYQQPTIMQGRHWEKKWKSKAWEVRPSHYMMGG